MAANNAAAPLHDRAILLGYKVGAGVSAELGQPSAVSFWVGRIDQPEEPAKIFATAGEVSKRHCNVG
jgi:hypothetical protein